MIPIAELVPRGVYRLHSRNLLVGVWDGGTGFIGIREKFHDEYLFKEFHWEQGSPYGTAKPLELLTTLPEDIEIKEHTPTICTACRKPAHWNKNEDNEFGKWFHTEDGTLLCEGGHPATSTYKPLFDFLKPFDEEASKQSRKEWMDKYGQEEEQD